MGEFWVKGEEAMDLLQYVTTNDVARLGTGEAQYTCFPNGRGGIVDDLIIYCYEQKKYMLVVNASNRKKDWNWLTEQNHFRAELEDASDQMAMIAVQGPEARNIVQKVVKDDLSSVPSFSFINTVIGSVGEVIVSATGYTGAGGFELYCYNEGAEKLWKLLIEKGAPMGLKPAGLAARDTLRLEMGYALYGNDIDDTTSPLEAGLGWIIKLKSKNDFIDRAFIEQQKETGVKRRLIGLELIDRGIPRKGYQVMSADQEEIGTITSGTMSPSLGKAIGMAYVRTEFSDPGTELFVRVRNKDLLAKVVKLPFLKN